MMVLELGSLDGPLWAFGSFVLSCHVVDGREFEKCNYCGPSEICTSDSDQSQMFVMGTL